MDDADRFDCKSSCGVAIMAKASAPGRTKTRLVPPLTFDEAAALNTVFLQDIAANVMLAGRHGSIAGYAAFAPHSSEDSFKGILPPTVGLIDVASRISVIVCCIRSMRFWPAGITRPWCSIPIVRRCPRRCWSSPPRCWRDRASAQYSALRPTAATIFWGSKPHIAGCSKTSPGDRKCRRADAGTGARDQARRSRPAAVVRRRRWRRPAPAPPRSASAFHQKPHRCPRAKLSGCHGVTYRSPMGRYGIRRAATKARCAPRRRTREPPTVGIGD